MSIVRITLRHSAAEYSGLAKCFDVMNFSYFIYKMEMITLNL